MGNLERKIDDAIISLKMYGSSLNTILLGRSYKIIGARFNNAYQEGFEILLQREEGGPEIAIAPATNRLRMIENQIVDISYRKNCAIYIEL